MAMPPQRSFLAVARGAAAAAPAAALGTGICATLQLTYTCRPCWFTLVHSRSRRWQPHARGTAICSRRCCGRVVLHSSTDAPTPNAVNPPLFCRPPPVQAPEEKARGITINATHGACRSVPRAASIQPGMGCCGCPA